MNEYPTVPSGRGNDGQFNDNGVCYCVGMFKCQSCQLKKSKTETQIHVPQEDKTAQATE